MIQLQENTQKDGRTARMMDGRTGRRTDRTYFIGPFWLRPGVKKMYGCFSFLFIFHSVKLQFSDIFWAHMEFWTYLGMPTHLMRNIGLDVFFFWLSVQIQTIIEINSFNLDWKLLLLPAITPEEEFSQTWIKRHMFFDNDVNCNVRLSLLQ